jgi:hypothetical protein
MRTLVFAALALFIAVSSSDAGAQSAKPQAREGFTISVGVGSGSVGFSCDGCGSDRQSDATGYLRIGGAVRPNLVNAGVARGWRHDVDANTTATTGFLLADAIWYPRVTTGWYLEGGVGAGQYRNKDNPSGTEFTATGGALSIGTGYDFRVAKNVSLTPFLSWSANGGAEVKQGGTGSFTNLNVNLFQIGLGFTWH